MKLGIAQKLFLAFLGLTLLVLIATLGLARWSFERGFFEYVNALEQNRLQAIAESLEEEYLAAGSDWSQLSQDQWQHSLAIAAPNQRPLRRQQGNGHRPPNHAKEDQRPQRQHRPPPRRRPGGPPTILLDLNEDIIAGQLPRRATKQTNRFPVTAGGETVGYLVSHLRRRFESPQETSFARQQLITSLLIGAASLLLAAIVSWWLARLLVAPVRRMISNVKQLSDGDYSTRMTQKNQDELGQLSTDINHLATTLEENRDSRRRWLADISHELRTPITILRGEIAALKDGIRPFNQQQLDSLGHETKRLGGLVDDLYQLSLSDMGGLRYDFAPCDLNDNLARALNSLSGIAGEKGITIQSDNQSGMMINADSSRIDQLLTNLISNSLFYTDAPGQLDISLKTQTDEQNAKTILLELADTPPGVTSEECQRLFEPLYRRDESRNRRTAGAGLGLAICQNIVKAHRGSISATPATNGGLCIRVIFPALTA